MRTRNSRLAALALAAAPLLAAAHPGHGAPSTAHWHATDAWGWALGLAVATLGWWLARRK
jgi:hypothetical protein